MLTMTPAAFAALLGNLQIGNPITLLLLSEAGARAATVGSAPWPFAQFQGACAAVAAACGYNVSNYGAQDQSNICMIVADFMRGLRYLAQGPSLAVPNGNFYNFIL
jgi:hypothetical protein